MVYGIFLFSSIMTNTNIYRIVDSALCELSFGESGGGNERREVWRWKV